jgi:hypothetical protein
VRARRRGIALVTALVGALAACDAVGAGPSAVVTRDSAGIAIVESSRLAWSDEDAWRVDPEPQVVIGEADGDAPYLLDRVEGATRLPDGRIVVADGGSNQLRFYDAAGTYLRAVGGSGGGPGEFEHLRALRRCGADSLFAFDLSWQLTVFTADGVPARNLDLKEPGKPTPPYALACSPTGRFAVSGWGDFAREHRIGLFRSTTNVWTLDAAGDSTADLGEHLGSERIGTQNGSGPHPFGRATAIALGADAVFLGSGEMFELRRHDLDGRLTHLWRAPDEDLAIAPAVLDAYRAYVLERVEPARHPMAERELREMPMPDGLPAYTRVEVDATGHVWVERFRARGDTAGVRWGVFAPDGAFLGHVTFPPRFTLHEIGDDHVIGTATDDEGVQRVQLHALRRDR